MHMLFHVSTDAEDPRRVARALAELMGGRATPFPAVTPGSWVAHAGDDRNTLVEVYPRGTELVPTDAGAEGVPGPGNARGPIHFALATPLSEREVHAIAQREGWPSATHSRQGLFSVIEVWLEGARLVELLTTDMQRDYLESVRLDRWEAMLEDMSAMA
jgi:hypothetical protein